MPPASSSVHRDLDAPRPFGRTFWLCVAAATVLAVIGVVVWLSILRKPPRPRYPGMQPAALAPTATRHRAAAGL